MRAATRLMQAMGLMALPALLASACVVGKAEGPEMSAAPAADLVAAPCPPVPRRGPYSVDNAGCAHGPDATR